MANFLSKEGLSYYDSLIKGVAVGALSIQGSTITITSVSGKSLGTVVIPQTQYGNASASQDGLMSSVSFKKLDGISEGATKTIASLKNGFINIDGVETKVYSPATQTALTAGLYKITTDATGAVTSGTKVVKSDITALGIPSQDTTYQLASVSINGLMSKDDYSKLRNVEAGAQVNKIETIFVNNQALQVNSKGVNIDLSGYALKSDISSAVNVKGSVDSYASLPSNPKQGDMYNIVNADPVHNINAGDNVVWNGKEWDNFGGVFSIDPVSNAEIDGLFK